jgi:hypothetical protein
VAALAYLKSDLAAKCDGRLCVAIVRTREDFASCLRAPAPGIEWLQVEGLIDDPEAWALAAQGSIDIPVDVILDDPATEFSSLYRLVDVNNVRAVSVTIPAKPGLMKALRLAASLHLHIRLLPGQPDSETLAELAEAAKFYLHDSMVETPVEFFHSLLAYFRGLRSGTLWAFLEQDPAVFSHCDAAGLPLHPAEFVPAHLARLIEDDSECASCRFQEVCAGYFKWPDAAYDCAGVKQLLSVFETAAAEISRELAEQEATT